MATRKIDDLKTLSLQLTAQAWYSHFPLARDILTLQELDGHRELSRAVSFTHINGA